MVWISIPLVRKIFTFFPMVWSAYGKRVGWQVRRGIFGSVHVGQKVTCRLNLLNEKPGEKKNGGGQENDKSQWQNEEKEEASWRESEGRVPTCWGWKGVRGWAEP